MIIDKYVAGFGALACAAGIHIAALAAPPGDPAFVHYAANALVAPGAAENKACQAAVHYLTLAGQGHFDQIGTIFTADAVYYGVLGDPIRGADKIGEFYATAVKRAARGAEIGSLVPAGSHDCYMEVVGHLKGGYDAQRSSAIDRFTTDDAGKVVELAIWFTPDGSRKLLEAAGAAPKP